MHSHRAASHGLLRYMFREQTFSPLDFLSSNLVKVQVFTIIFIFFQTK